MTYINNIIYLKPTHGTAVMYSISRLYLSLFEPNTVVSRATVIIIIVLLRTGYSFKF